MLIGEMEVLTDQATKNRLWRKGDFYSIKVVELTQTIAY